MSNQNESLPDVGLICHNWWKQHINLDTGHARACRAHLRRARSSIEALEIEATHELNADFTKIGEPLQRQPEKLSAIVIVLAHVNTAVKYPVASSFGKKKGEGRTLSKIRFSALLKANTKELIVRLPRALSLIEGQANVARLASDLFYWGDKVRARWCYEYYGFRGTLPSTGISPI